MVTQVLIWRGPLVAFLSQGGPEGSSDREKAKNCCGVAGHALQGHSNLFTPIWEGFTAGVMNGSETHFMAL